MIKHYWLYVLRLEQGKYYVGQTSGKDPNRRIQQHMNGFYSAQWVKKYKPIEPIEKIDLGIITKAEADDLENHRTLQYMKKYSYQNVRGGKYRYSGKYAKIGHWLFPQQYYYAGLGLSIMTFAFAVLVVEAWK